jgi:hypothetical protein
MEVSFGCDCDLHASPLSHRIGKNTLLLWQTLTQFFGKKPSDCLAEERRSGGVGVTVCVEATCQISLSFSPERERSPRHLPPRRLCSCYHTQGALREHPGNLIAPASQYQKTKPDTSPHRRRRVKRHRREHSMRREQRTSQRRRTRGAPLHRGANPNDALPRDNRSPAFAPSYIASRCFSASPGKPPADTPADAIPHPPLCVPVHALAGCSTLTILTAEPVWNCCVRLKEGEAERMTGSLFASIRVFLRRPQITNNQVVL